MLCLIVAGLLMVSGAGEPGSGAGPTSQPASAPATQPVNADGPEDGSGEAVKRWLTPAAADQPQPKIVCAEPIAYVGDMWGNQDGTGRWVIANEGAAPLRLYLRQTCHFSVRGARHRTVPPGESITIEAAVEDTTRGVITREGLTVLTNDPLQPKVLLGYRKNGRVAYVVHRDEKGAWPLDFGELRRDRDQPLTRTAVLTRGDGGPLAPRITEVISVPWAARTTADLREVRAGEEYELTVTVEPPWSFQSGSFPSGQLRRGGARFKTGVTEQPEGSVWTSAGCAPRLTWDDVLPVPPKRDEPYKRRTRLRWSDDAPPGRFTSVECETDGMMARVEERDGQPVLVFSVAPECPAPEKGWYGITLKADDPWVPATGVNVRVPFR